MPVIKELSSSINFIKGVAIILVTYFHLARHAKISITAGSFDFTQAFRFGDIGVNLFFFISVFLMFIGTVAKNVWL